MYFQALPHELMIQIVSNLYRIQDIYHLMLVNRAFHNLLVPEIYQRHTLDRHGKVLLKYVAAGNKSGVRVMLSQGADINYRPRDKSANTALQIAIDDKTLDLVKFLLEKGAQPNLAITHPEYKRRPLDSSVHNFPKDDLDMMILLLDYGADPNFPNYNGKTPFFTSVELGHFTKMETLLARGADLKIRASLDGSTVLHEAIRHFRPSMMQFLLEKGHEMNCVDDQNRSPLMLAVRYREDLCSTIDLTQILLTAGADVNFTAPDGRNALLEAASCGTRDMVQLLIDHGADVGFIGPNGRNILYEATHNNKERAIAILTLLLEWTWT
ncbi:hypothetical protein N7478_007828 [Penicillium angulare]|uniref:uncharacterized protein n=1 Tax=Penicillium angulare TaxID=116970 RepID=UPI00253FF7E6|nr:uncharacterized protein N7478_007828 [Penicillium angulare]KAJ5272703.1 hypothetical protein N7478_007828 [Penicillium angulare]